MVGELAAANSRTKAAWVRLKLMSILLLMAQEMQGWKWTIRSVNTLVNWIGWFSIGNIMHSSSSISRWKART
jgi:hypothetical protein